LFIYFGSFRKKFNPGYPKNGDEMYSKGGGWGKREENGRNSPELTGGWRDDRKK
jgi:hypothetical protein